MRNYIWLSTAPQSLRRRSSQDVAAEAAPARRLRATPGHVKERDNHGGIRQAIRDVYNACIDAIQGTAAEQAGQAGCAQTRDAFEQCQTAAENASGSARETALNACQDAANKTTDALKSAP